MSIAPIQSTSNATMLASQSSQQNTSTTSPAASFASTLASLDNGTSYSDGEVKSFFAGKPSEKQIASQAAALGLNENQIMQAMIVGGYGVGDTAALKAGIDGYVAIASNGYAWDSNGALTASKVQIQAAGASDKVMPSAVEIKSFYATNPSEQQVTAKVKALGLNAAQMVQFEVTGEGMNMAQVSAHVLESRYVDAANKLGADIGGGKNGGWTSYFSPNLGRAVTKSEMQDFFSQKPSQAKVFQKAADLGLGVSAVNSMMVGLGITKTAAASDAMYNQMELSLFQGADGFSLDQFGHIVAGGGKEFVPNGSGGSWVARSPGASDRMFS